MLLALRILVLTLGMFASSAPAVCAQEREAKSKFDTALVESVKPARPASSQVLDRIAEFFRMPIVNVALVALGVLGLIFEFKLPGTTFPGSVAAICFVLFFWAYSFVGEFTLL